MTWGQRAIEALERGRGEAVVLEAEDLRVRFRVEEADRVGCAILGLSVEDLRSSAKEEADLEAWSGRVAGRVTYLMERVAAIETDGATGMALLRSVPPDRRDEARAYYEIVLKSPGALALTRYRYQNGDRTRKEVPCALTREVFERLVEDLAGAMRG